MQQKYIFETCFKIKQYRGLLRLTSPNVEYVIFDSIYLILFQFSFINIVLNHNNSNLEVLYELIIIIIIMDLYYTESI